MTILVEDNRRSTFHNPDLALRHGPTWHIFLANGLMARLCHCPIEESWYVQEYHGGLATNWIHVVPGGNMDLDTATDAAIAFLEEIGWT